MHLQPHLNIEYFLKKEINELYVTHALKSFAISTISIFLPIFFLKKGYSLQEVMIYFLIHSIFATIFCYTALRFTSKKGVTHSMVLSIPFFIVFFMGLYNMEFIFGYFDRILLMILLALIITIAEAHYWMAFHVDFARFSDNNKTSSQIGLVQSLGVIFSIVGPLFGALVISFASFETLFLIVTIVLIISVVPMFFSKETHEPFEFEIKRVFSSKEFKHNWPFFAEGIRDYGARIFWPILLYMLAINIKELGGIFTLSNAVLAVFTFYVGKKITEGNKRRILKTGAITHSITLVIRSFLRSISFIAFVQGFGALTFSMLNIPFHLIFYQNSKNKGISQIVYTRDLYLNIARFIATALLIILLFFIKPVAALTTMIIIGGLFALFMTWIKDEL